MPTFIQEGKYVEEIFVDVEQFFHEMEDGEKRDMLNLLTHEGYTKSGYNPTQLMSIDQQEFISALEKLESRYYSLSKEDEQKILQIAKKF
jgi:hypothetical protein